MASHLAFLELFSFFRGAFNRYNLGRRANLLRGGEMYKAFLLILCLLACTTIVVAQGSDTRRPAPRPTGQQVNPDISALTKELLQSDRLRAFARETIIRKHFEQQRARARGAVPPPNQHPLTLRPVTGVLGGFPDYTPDPNLLKHGPFGPDVKYDLSGPIGEGWDFEGFKRHPLENVSNQIQEGFKQATGGINQSIEAADRLIEIFNQLPQQVDQYQRQIAASNQPPVHRTADNRLGPQPLASAASHVPKTRLRVVKRERVLVRSNRNGFPIGTLFKGDDFIAKDRDRKNLYVVGYAEGNVQKPGWTRFDSKLKGHLPAHSNPRVPILTGDDARRHLLDNYASEINKLDSQPSPATIVAPTPAYRNYDFENGIPLDMLNRQLLPDDPNRKFAWRYITKDGNYVMGRECRIDPATNKCVENVHKNWVFVPRCAVAIKGKPLLCQQ
jgi:hypothetical protein